MATASSPTKVWDKDDVIALVVWLDVCRQCEEDIKYEQTITDHLFNTRKKSFTYSQVRSKLQTLARSNHLLWETKTSKTMALHHILRRGSSLLFPRLEKTCIGPEQLQQRVDNCLIENNLHKSTNMTGALVIENQSQDAQLPTTRHKTIADRTSENGPADSLDGQDHASFHHPDHDSAQYSTGREVIPQIEEPLPRSETLKTGLNITSTLQERWEKEMEALLAKNVELQEKNRRLGDLLQLAENAQELRGQTSKDPQEGLIHIHIAMIYEQQQKITSLQVQVPKLARIPTQALHLPQGKLDGTMQTLGSEIESLLHGTNCFHLQAPEFPESCDLGLLLQSFKIESNLDCTLKSFLESWVSEYGLPATMRTLALAALRDWVFASDFPDYGGNGASSVLLNSYRDIIYNLGDWNTSRNYDIAAYSQMFNSEQFTLMILPLRATQLADRFMKAIDGVLCSKSVEQYLQPQSQKRVKDLHSRLVEIFKASLDLKAHTVVTDNEYLFMVHPMGTPFTHTTQPGDSSNRSETRTSATSWLHASFRVYPAKPPNINNRKSDAIVQTTNFMLKEGETRHNCLVEKHIAVRKSERGAIGSGQRSLGKRPLPSDFQNPRPHKRRSPLPRDSIDLSDGTQAGSHLNGPDVVSRTCDCGEILATIHGYQRHRAKNSCRRCNSCGKKFGSNRQSDLWKHLRTQHPESEQTKRLSVQDFAQPIALTTDPKAQELPDKAQFRCDKCPKSFSRGDTLTKHKNERRCSWCYKCSRDFRYGRLLREHQEVEHKPSNHNVVPSRTASTFQANSTPKTKLVHQNNKGVRSHQSEKGNPPRNSKAILPLRCLKCPESQLEEFASPGDLKRHERRIHREVITKGRPLPGLSFTPSASTSPTIRDTVSPNPERQLPAAQTVEASIDDTGLGFTRLASKERATYRQRQESDRKPSHASSRKQARSLQATSRSPLGLEQPAAFDAVSSSCTVEDSEREIPSQEHEALVEEPEIEKPHEDNAQSQVPEQRSSSRPKSSFSSLISVQIPFNKSLRKGLE